MKSQVFFADRKTGSGKSLLDKLDALLDRTALKGKIREKDLVAIKLHFGEKGNTAFIRPLFVRRMVERVKRYKGKPFLTDTNTLYAGTRSEAVSHLTTAYQHGFAYSVVDAPVLIADGLRGNSAIKVRIDKPLFKTVSIAHEISMADVLLCVTHFKGHELAGFGGALKNLGMGCASREAKLSQHSNLGPKVVRKKHKACGLCMDGTPLTPYRCLTERPESTWRSVLAVGCASSFARTRRLRSGGTRPLRLPRGSLWNMLSVPFRTKRARPFSSTFSSR